MKFFAKAALASAAIFAAASVASATTYNGNGGSGFGGPLGGGNITITDTASSITFTVNAAPATNMNDVVVIYLNTLAGGFTDTSLLTDVADGGRRAVSGTDGTNRTLVQFAPGFGADRALFLGPGFGFFGTFDITNTPGNFSFGTGIGVGGPGAGSWSLTLSAADALNFLGISLGSGGSFDFVATYLSESAYRSNETVGASITVPDPNNPPNGGFNGTQTFTESLTYTLVPEPTSLAIVGLGALGLLARRRQA